MSTNETRQNAHNEIDYIFKVLLPKHNMAERLGQITLSHQMLDAMLDGSISLCEAGTGIGKTYAYLVAGTVFQRFRAKEGLAFQPILISTSSIALQNAVQYEYLPFLSAILLEAGLAIQPLRAVIRKGKSHYVCDERLERRLKQIQSSRKNPAAVAALRSLLDCLDIDEAADLSRYDRERVCVPQACDCRRTFCRYVTFLVSCDLELYTFQICNHNLLLADAIHRSTGRKPLLPDRYAVIIDEAHKLPETARHMFGVTLEAEDIRALIRELRREKYLLASEILSEMTAPLLRRLDQPPDDRLFAEYARLLIAPARALTTIRKQLTGGLPPSLQKSLEDVSSAITLFAGEHPDIVCYAEEDCNGGTMLCASVSDLTSQLQSTLWNQPQPIILTSGTMAVGSSFRRFREETGLLTSSRVRESVSLSPFDYRKNCLLYLPQSPPHKQEETYYDNLAGEISQLLDAACGHALVLFTSYAAMSAVKVRLAEKKLVWPLFTMGRNAVHTTEQFKAQLGSVLLATGAAWEGFDFPGDCVSLLVIPRLPFPRPDALKEKAQEQYPDLRSFIRAVVVPEMQIKLKQGFGRAIRTETDTCVIAVLDERASPGNRYHKDVLATLPEMPVTNSLEDVERFIRTVKDGSYFTMCS